MITRGEWKGSIAINKNEVVECEIQKNLKIVDLTLIKNITGAR